MPRALRPVCRGREPPHAAQRDLDAYVAITSVISTNRVRDSGRILVGYSWARRRTSFVTTDMTVRPWARGEHRNGRENRLSRALDLTTRIGNLGCTGCGRSISPTQVSTLCQVQAVDRTGAPFRSTSVVTNTTTPSSGTPQMDSQPGRTDRGVAASIPLLWRSQQHRGQPGRGLTV